MKAFSPAALVLTLAAVHAEPVVLDNRWIKAVVDPGAGGRVVQLLHKPTGRQFTEALTLNDAPGGSGLFNDCFWKRRQTRDLETSPYEVTHAEPGVRVDMVRAHGGSGDTIRNSIKHAIVLLLRDGRWRTGACTHVAMPV